MTDTIKWAARAGYAAKGLIYVAIGVLAALAAFGEGGVADSTEAIRRMAQSLGGQVTLSVMAVGLVAYVLWRAVQTFADPEGKGNDTKGLLTRSVYAGSGIAYGLLAVTVIQALLQGGNPRGGNSSEEASQALLALPGGRWALGLVGLIILGRGIAEGRKAVSADFRKKLTSDMGFEVSLWAVRVGRTGLAARSLVFLTMGAFFVHAAWVRSSEQARGLEGVLATMQQVGGPVLLGAVAVGLFCYGLYQWVKAAYRRLPD